MNQNNHQKKGLIYYSNYCESCKKLLAYLGKSEAKQHFHFVCIDKRVKSKDGQLYVILENGQQILLPPSIERVPAMVILASNQVLFGEQIYGHIQSSVATPPPSSTQYNNASSNTRAASLQTMEPSAFSFSGGCGVASDHFSFLDMDLTAKGNGGMRMMHNYVSCNDEIYSSSNQLSIQTPPNNYSREKIGNIKMEDLMQKRQLEISSVAPKYPTYK